MRIHCYPDKRISYRFIQVIQVIQAAAVGRKREQKSNREDIYHEQIKDVYFMDDVDLCFFVISGWM